jgi:hypothetical protein
MPLPRAQVLDPGRKTLREEIRVEGVDHVVQRVARRDAAPERQKRAQEAELGLAPLGLSKCLGPGQRGAEHHKHDLRQRILDLPGLARVAKGEKWSIRLLFAWGRVNKGSADSKPPVNHNKEPAGIPPPSSVCTGPLLRRIDQIRRIVSK